jgi:methyl-accepting chemotaxis protein
VSYDHLEKLWIGDTLAFPTGVDLILIVSLLGIIAISIYTLYLEDKLLSRIEALEQSFLASHTGDKKLERNPELVTLSEQIAVTNEILESTGKDIDSINSKMASFVDDLVVATQKIEAVGEGTSENRNTISSIWSDISDLTKKLEQLEKEAKEGPSTEPPLEF